MIAMKNEIGSTEIDNDFLCLR